MVYSVVMNSRLIPSISYQGGCIMKRVHTFSLLGASALLLTSVGLAMSEDGREKVTVASLPTSVTMEEAIKTATTQFPGKVLEAELESEDGKVIYEVEIVNATGEIREVEVDAQSGKILSSELEDQDTHEKGGSHKAVSYTHLRAHETDSYLVCR